MSDAPHSMTDQERGLALEVLASAWQRLAAAVNPGPPRIADVVQSTALQLVETNLEVTSDYARHVGAAAIWYLDRAIRRVADPERDGLTPKQQLAKLAWFAEDASAADLEALFAVAVALDNDDV